MTVEEETQIATELSANFVDQVHAGRDSVSAGNEFRALAQSLSISFSDDELLALFNSLL